MNRWNISSIFFLGVRGDRRDITFEPKKVNIITGASGTGKSTIIKAIDYCLGSSKCELPAHVRRKSIAVGVKWVAGSEEMIVGRIIPPVGQATSTHMYTTSGRNLTLPVSLDTFEGATTLDTAKAFIEEAFGIGDSKSVNELGFTARGRATIRQVTAYLFVTKEVIDSESILFHGLEKPDKARDIINAMPYFLRAIDETTANDERRLKHLLKILENQEAIIRVRSAARNNEKNVATTLLHEAHRIGLTAEPSINSQEGELITQLQQLSETQLEASSYPTEEELSSLHQNRQNIRQRRATLTALREANGFKDIVSRQHDKLLLAQHFNLNEISNVCPFCETPSDRGKTIAISLTKSLEKVSAESIAVSRVQPKLAEYDRTLDDMIQSLSAQLRVVDNQIRSWLSQNEQTRQLANLSQLRAHLLGRISFFMDSLKDYSPESQIDLGVIKGEIADLEAKVDKDAVKIKLQRAERKISQFASEAMAKLPTVAPCINSEIEFNSRKPEVCLIEKGTEALLRMSDVGSDQNYLAIHLALSFALQNYFSLVKAPVPGILILDQISRPYFPTRGEEAVDETEVAGNEEDEEFKAMRQHIDFLFTQTEAQPGLQVILIEHAYFADDPRYVSATRQRWTRASGEALIPIDWPTRNDE
jgi:energy-coupling factor transporter ATP-binding protein EcfA2